MRVIDSALQAPHVVETRRKAFEDFVREKNMGGYAGTGWTDAALCNVGYADYFGPVTFERGMYNGCWIIPDGGDNGKVLIFPSRKDAQNYGNTLLPVLKSNGYANSKVYVQQVAFHSSSPRSFMGSLANSESYDDRNRFILRIKVRK